MKSPNAGFFYELREGEVWWVSPDAPWGTKIGKTVSILYDSGRDWVLLKHGSPELVSADMDRMSILGDLAIAEIPIRGPYDIEKINKIISTTGYLKGLLCGSLMEV